jgi:hypothetical protein
MDGIAVIPSCGSILMVEGPGQNMFLTLFKELKTTFIYNA